MNPIGWRGAVPRELAAALAAAGLQVVRDDTADVRAWVVAEATPAPPAAGPWLWLAPQPVGAEARAQAVLAGAYDVLERGEPDLAARLCTRLGELTEGPSAEASARALPVSGGFIGHSPAIERVRAQIARAARTSMPVLITGETGTGKEVAARLVHTWSARQAARFVPINCAAIPNELMEAELFGYAKGAFSGAVSRFDGWLMAAEGGTVFLDEIDDTPIPTQVKLLRVLEDRVVTRLGETEPHHVDFRILAATNRDLRALIDAGTFGGDFYERLAIVSIHLVPLRERREDIPALAQHFVTRYYAQEPTPEAQQVRALSPSALEALSAYPWPGNVRELRNVVFATLVDKRRGHEILLSDLPRYLLVRAPQPTAEVTTAWSRDTIARALAEGRFSLRQALATLERTALELALEQSGGSPTAAARLLGEIGRGHSSDPGGTVRAMMRRHGLSPR
jgi:two-component system NtrC family response regulator